MMYHLDGRRRRQSLVYFGNSQPWLIRECRVVADRDRVERRLEHLLLLLHLYLSGHDSRTLDQPLRRRKLRTRRNAPGTRRDV